MKQLELFHAEHSHKPGRKKLQLVEGWRSCWRWWSLQASAIGTGILAAFFAFPEAMIGIWGLLPHDLRALVPPEQAKWIPIAILLVGMAGRLIKQKAKE